MTGSIRTRLGAALGAVALAAAGVVIAAPAAHASGPDCANLLAGGDPARSTVDIHLLCKVGAAGVPTVSDAVCNTGLAQVSQVSPTRAASACSQARR
ncbi:hypothetical protein [Streptomyces abikoensis]